MREELVGHRGLDHEESLLFMLDTPGSCGVDLPEPVGVPLRIGLVRERGCIGLPDVVEPTVVRHYTRLSRKNYAIDLGMYPLGSCTMKHNPRLNERLACLEGLSALHPLQPLSTVQGALELLETLVWWLKALTGMEAVALSPGAGAHGELCGLMAIRRAIESREGEKVGSRCVVLVPESAHGTNPATAVMCGFRVQTIRSNERGMFDMGEYRRYLGEDVAGVMLTNPNTCGLFEDDILEIADLVHEYGGFLYGDGANFNALVGRVKPVDLGIDAMHINLHKTFSTPHGGGGPGSGPVVFSSRLASYVPYPYVVRDGLGWRLVETGFDELATGEEFGRLKAFHGQMGMFIRALSYMLSYGGDGLRCVSGDAVLSANYLRVRLQDMLSCVYEGLCMHEVLFDDRCLRGTGVKTQDIAKAMIDYGFHPMTVYFPLIVSGAMLLEPTETESKRTLDEFVMVLRTLIERAQKEGISAFSDKPCLVPRMRLDETRAARHPVLRWTPERS